MYGYTYKRGAGMPTKRIKTNPFLEEHLWRRFKATCALMNVWPSDVLEEMIEQWLKRNEQKARTQVEEEP
jgi:ParG